MSFYTLFLLSVLNTKVNITYDSYKKAVGIL